MTQLLLAGRDGVSETHDSFRYGQLIAKRGPRGADLLALSLILIRGCSYLSVIFPLMFWSKLSLAWANYIISLSDRHAVQLFSVPGISFVAHRNRGARFS